MPPCDTRASVALPQAEGVGVPVLETGVAHPCDAPRPRSETSGEPDGGDAADEGADQRQRGTGAAASVLDDRIARPFS